MGIVKRLKAVEARADAWAANCLTPAEYAEAAEFDRVIKANFLSWGAGYVLGTVLLGALLLGIKPALSIQEALLLANAILFSLFVGLMGLWFGHRRHAGKPLWRKVVAITLVTAAGAITGALGAKLAGRRDLLSIDAAEWIRFASIGILAGLVLAALVVGVGWIRGREARAREAQLRAEAERERLAKRTAEAELKLLQAQVEPHFLFNTLANLRYLVQAGSRDALPMLDHLIDYLRTALPEMRRGGSSLGREAALARAYLEILRIRMGGELAFAIDAPADLDDEPIPPLMLMTLVENAVKHGIAPVGHGRIDIRFERVDGAVRVSVADDGRGLAAAPAEGVGLANVRERLAAIHGPGATLSLGPREGGGAVATITLPASGTRNEESH